MIFIVMVGIGALRHVFWVNRINRNEWSWKLAIPVGLVNNWFDWTHAQCRLLRGRDDGIGPLSILGITAFGCGSVIETVSEVQRRNFKMRPENDNEIYKDGLFARARHVNYFGYILWRTGLGLVSGPPYTLSYSVYHAVDFYYRAIPLLAKHMEESMGEEKWEEYKRETKYVLIPGIL
eukprot:CAMPEP_0172509740 /NCGR_PEP_ID=MMETSP1066-20121228/222693_1 /TAXON_ID=671091 /ORGANISM="Coscinodiscus wailesii, Strain CCMP2513" /LENGTH=177 /DNA_ID=CAMNT_0013288367 /DNA_START=401 /DNA_END=934 /DNA_ORIENTATION=+